MNKLVVAAAGLLLAFGAGGFFYLNSAHTSKLAFTSSLSGGYFPAELLYHPKVALKPSTAGPIPTAVAVAPPSSPTTPGQGAESYSGAGASSSSNGGGGHSTPAPPPTAPPAPPPTPAPPPYNTGGTLPTLTFSLSDCPQASSITLSNSRTSASVDCTLASDSVGFFLPSSAWGDNYLTVSWSVTTTNGTITSTFNNSASGVDQDVDSPSGAQSGYTSEELTFRYSWA